MENENKPENEEEEKESPLNRARQYLYYFIIGIISFVALVFLPMLGSSVGIEWNLPDTAAGWIVWGVMKLIVAMLNVLIFHSFMQQGRLNVKDHPNYIEAQKILQKVRVKNAMPRSPKQFNGKQYGRKGIMIFASTSLATIALTQAALSFNWIDMLTYLFTIIMGIIFGILQMKTAEDYWRDEYLRYALMKKDEAEREEKRTRGFAETLRNRPRNREAEKVEEFIDKTELSHTEENKEEENDNDRR